MTAVELSVRTLARSPYVVAGLLLLAIGLADLFIGRSKLQQYHELLAQTPVSRPRDRATLFPKVTEAEEQRSVARAKLGYYNLLFLAGQTLTLGGLILIVIGLVQLRRAPIEPLILARSR